MILRRYYRGNGWRRLSLDERFDEKWMVEPNTGCHLWLAATNAFGYGQFKIPERQVPAHRFAYERKYGPVPHGLVLDHYACDTPACCNPDHVRPVTNTENVLRSAICLWAINARKTHCPRGHEFTSENTWSHKGRRHCRACKRAQSNAWKERSGYVERRRELRRDGKVKMR
jgi:hypothetical protein